MILGNKQLSIKTFFEKKSEQDPRFMRRSSVINYDLFLFEFANYLQSMTSTSSSASKVRRGVKATAALSHNWVFLGCFNFLQVGMKGHALFDLSLNYHEHKILGLPNFPVFQGIHELFLKIIFNTLIILFQRNTGVHFSGYQGRTPSILLWHSVVSVQIWK